MIPDLDIWRAAQLMVKRATPREGESVNWRDRPLRKYVGIFLPIPNFLGNWRKIIPEYFFREISAGLEEIALTFNLLGVFFENRFGRSAFGARAAVRKPRDRGGRAGRYGGVFRYRPKI